MAGPLLATKLHVPRRQRGLVARPRLSERPSRGADSALTLVSALAGFGKTTLLAQWLAAAPAGRQSAAWLSLDQRDNDPAPAARVGHWSRGAGHEILAAPGRSIYVVFQQATGYQAPVWPPADGQQRPMMYFDFQVGDLDSAVAEAIALGASVATYQPQDNVRLLLDPAGHPFCLCRDDG